MEEFQGKTRSLTIKQKLQIIKMVESGKSVKEVSEEVGVNRNTLHYILKNRGKISEASKKPGLSCHKRIKQTKNPELETFVLDFIRNAKENGENLTGSLIKAVALEASLKMNCNNFAASNGWLHSFLKRNGISMSDLNRSLESSKSSKPRRQHYDYHLVKEEDSGDIVVMYNDEINESSKQNEELPQEIEREELEEVAVEEDQDTCSALTIDWRIWCRLCGNVRSEEIVQGLDMHFVELISTLLKTTVNDDVRVCDHCYGSLEDIMKMAKKGKQIEGMFNELEERERKNCLTDENIVAIRQEYGADEEEEITSRLEEVEEICNETSDEQQLEEEREVETEENANNMAFEIDYLYETEDMELSQEDATSQEESIQPQEATSEDGYEIVEEETIEEIEEEYPSIESEKMSMKLLKDEEPYTYTCHICFETFERMCFLTNHTRQFHDCLPQVACTCGKLLSTWESLMNHKRKHTTENAEWVCELCDARFMTKTGLSIHVRFKHEKEQRDYRCNECGLHFKDGQMLRNHERGHQSFDQKYQVECEICFKKLANKYSLKHHILSVHEQQKTVICHLCSKSFSNRSNLKSHLISHTTEHVKCEICNSVFKNRISLQSHKKIHKPKELLNFACTQCNKKFHNRNHLQRHQISHSDVKSFQCTLCSMAYKWEKDLKNHMATHNGERDNK